MKSINNRLFYTIFFLTVILLIFTRIYGLLWGFPYLFNPDERNMITAVLSLSPSNGFNPNFYAYGQLPLYIVYGFFSILQKSIYPVITPLNAAAGLRALSSISSLITAVFLFLYIKRQTKNNWTGLFSIVLFALTPAFIQFAHFGTTESVLIMLFVILLFFSQQTAISGFITGLAVGIKLSSALFFVIPALFFIEQIIFKKHINFKKKFFDSASYMARFMLFFIAGAFISAPHIVLSTHSFISSMHYELSVASGALKVFYTQQFKDALPFLFQIKSIFPFALGIPLMLTTGFGLIVLLFSYYKNIVFYWLFFFAAAGLTYTKWTRFSVFVFILSIIITSFLFDYLYLRHKNIFFKKAVVFLGIILIFLQFIYAVSYISIYAKDDARIRADKWINNYAKSGSIIITESANVVDVPIQKPKGTRVYSFFLYDIDANSEKQKKLWQAYKSADYIIIPSRRVFANFTCAFNKKYSAEKCTQRKRKYPVLNAYYTLLENQTDFKQTAVFSSYPTVDIPLLGKYSINDEFAEETWSVFDHAVVRIYKRRVD